MPELRPYYSARGLSARYYDLVTKHDPSLQGDIALYAGLAPPGGAVLELGSGTGRVAFALAERGVRVMGVDLAPAMIALAEAKRALLQPAVAERVTFRRGDMAAFDAGEAFDAVICPFFGLAHLPGGTAWRNTFQVIARHLQPGGRCAVHLPIAERMAGPGPHDPSRPVMRLDTGEAGRTLELFVRERRFRPAIGRMDQVLSYVVTDPVGAVEACSFERQTYYAADPDPHAQAAGLVLDGPPVRLGDSGDVHLYRKA